MGKKIGSANTWYVRFGSNVMAECDVPSQPTEYVSLCNDYIFAGGRRLAAAGTDQILPGFEQAWKAGEPGQATLPEASVGKSFRMHTYKKVGGGAVGTDEKPDPKANVTHSRSTAPPEARRAAPAVAY